MGAQRSGLWTRIAQLASAGGTVYLVLSLFPLGYLLAAGRGWPTERSTVISVTRHDGREFDGFGLTYEGLGGGLLLWSELLAVIAALLLSRGGGCFARIAHLGLAAWALMLAANFWWVISAGDYRAVDWMLPIVTLGAGLVVARGFRSSDSRATEACGPA
jgi:hypothetical protein